MLGFMRKKIVILIIVATGLFSIGFITGCSNNKSGAQEISLEEQIVPLAPFEPAFTIPIPEAPGILTKVNDKAFIDYSNMSDGYVTVGFTESTDKTLKVLITTPYGEEYIYSLTPGISEVFPSQAVTGNT